MPGGLDRFENEQVRELAARILSAGGCIVSEQPPGREPDLGTRRARDRIQVALTSLVVVVESEPDGGALVGARRALELGRPVAVLDERLLARLPGALAVAPHEVASLLATS